MVGFQFKNYATNYGLISKSQTIYFFGHPYFLSGNCKKITLWLVYSCIKKTQ